MRVLESSLVVPSPEIDLSLGHSSATVEISAMAIGKFRVGAVVNFFDDGRLIRTGEVFGVSIGLSLAVHATYDCRVT